MCSAFSKSLGVAFRASAPTEVAVHHAFVTEVAGWLDFVQRFAACLSRPRQLLIHRAIIDNDGFQSCRRQFSGRRTEQSRRRDARPAYQSWP